MNKNVRSISYVEHILQQMESNNESITDLIKDDKLAPQEMELQLQKATGLSEEKVKKFLDTYMRLNNGR